MRVGILMVVALLAACNQSRSGVNDRVLFTPVECGQIAGCDFDDSVGVYGTISLQITGIDGQPTAGLDLASRDANVATVARRADISNAPAWDLTAVAPGVVDVAAIDGNGIEIDFVQVGVQDVTRLTMVPFVGDIVGPTAESGYDEAFTIAALQDASWFVRPVIAGDVTTMGRFSFLSVLDPAIAQYEAGNSDRLHGYLFVYPPAGDYHVRFELAADDSVGVDAVIHAR